MSSRTHVVRKITKVESRIHFFLDACKESSTIQDVSRLPIDVAAHGIA